MVSVTVRKNNSTISLCKANLFIPVFFVSFLKWFEGEGLALRKFNRDFFNS
jgi:hypothetical protein